MLIKLSPLRRDDTLEVIKTGDVLTVNGEDFDFSPIGEGDTLPALAISSTWFLDKVCRIEGELVLTLFLPLPWNYSQEQAFPVPLQSVPDGSVVLPKPLPSEPPVEEHILLPNIPEKAGVIDWSQLITKEMKDAAEAVKVLAEAKAELAGRNAVAAAQILRIQDRIDTLGYGIDSGEATAEDEAEQAALIISLKAWKAYKFALGKVATQTTWPLAPNWPTAPAIPDITADPAALSPEAV